jgi:ssRNA-specific RNase YbeY (16S rRNA maturation enzyme)
MVNKTIVNKQCPVKDKMLVERENTTCMLHGLLVVFHVNGADSRERQTEERIMNSEERRVENYKVYK